MTTASLAGPMVVRKLEMSCDFIEVPNDGPYVEYRPGAKHLVIEVEMPDGTIRRITADNPESTVVA